MNSSKVGKNIKKWLYFRIGDIFDDVSIAKSVDLLNLGKDENGINYVGRTRENNGITARVCTSDSLIDLINEGNCVTTVMVGNSTCSTFFQHSDFFASQNILVLRSKHLNQHNALFIANIIHLEKYRFSYGRTLTKSFFNNHMIKLPSNKDDPDWQFMEDHIKNIRSDFKEPCPEPLIKQKRYINYDRWEDFSLSGLFQIEGSVTTSSLKLEEYGQGEYPYVTTQATNNGVKGFYDYYTEEGNVLTIDSAVLGYCSYQSLPFSASDHVEKLIPKFDMNKYVALFICTIINSEQYRYNYGRKCSQARMGKSHIKLPAKSGGLDFRFMERYIKSLPYSSNL